MFKKLLNYFKRPKFTCPRRSEYNLPCGWYLKDADYWHKRDELEVCSCCGSLHPDEFMMMVRNRCGLEPTDKNYKVYVLSKIKFYFQHLNLEQRQEFIDLLKVNKLKVYGGSFYVLPFFIGVRSKSASDQNK